MSAAKCNGILQRGGNGEVGQKCAHARVRQREYQGATASGTNTYRWGGKNTYIFFGGVSAPETIQAATSVLFLIQKGRGGGEPESEHPPPLP